MKILKQLSLLVFFAFLKSTIASYDFSETDEELEDHDTGVEFNSSSKEDTFEADPFIPLQAIAIFPDEKQSLFYIPPEEDVNRTLSTLIDVKSVAWGDVEKLDLSNKGLGDRAIFELIEKISGNLNLKEINLSGNVIKDAGAFGLSRMIRLNKVPNLISLNLERNQLGEIGAETFDCMAREIGVNLTF